MKSKLIFLLTFFSSILPNEMRIYEYPELFKYKNDSIEVACYNLLKNNPIKKNINFLPVNWGYIQARKKYNLLDGINLSGDTFTICSLDFYEDIIPILKKIGVNILFATSASTKKHKDIKIISIPYKSPIGDIYPSEKKDIFYSFIGAETCPLRNQIFKFPHPPNTIVIKRDSFHFAFDHANLMLRTNQYKDILSRSRFSLCPKGNGVGTFRFWESLQAGAIPVLLSDDYLLPRYISWNKCIIRIKENDYTKIPAILNSISSNVEKEMRDNCLKVFADFCGNNIDKIIRLYFEANKKLIEVK